MTFVNIFPWSHPSQLCVFVRVESFFLPRIWKVSNLVFIFKILFSFILNKMMVTGIKAVVRAEILRRDFLQTLGSCYFSFTTAKIQRLKIIHF